MSERWKFLRPRGPTPVLALIAWREVVMRLRSRVFLAGTVLMVALMVVGVIIASVLARQSTIERIGFTPSVSALVAPVSTTAASIGLKVSVSAEPDQASGEAAVRAGTLDVLVSGTPTNPTTLSHSGLPPSLKAILDSVARSAALDAALSGAGLDPSAVAASVAAAGLTSQTTEPADPQRVPQLLVGFAVSFTLYLALAIYGSFVAQGVVEEKATRIVEILLATVRPRTLLAGKIIGIALVGLAQLGVLVVTALVLVNVSGVVSIPAVSPISLAGDLVWFLLGFYLYATAYAAAASLISRPEEVAGGTAPISVFLILSYLLIYAVLADPGSPTSVVLSLLPPFAPMLMSFRAATGSADPTQVLVAMALTLAAALALTVLAGRIYANSVLRTGSRANLREALRRH